MADVVVVGGGITGLTTALTLFHNDVDVRLLEASDRVGGKILTSYLRGTLVDEAADAFLVREPHMLELCEQLNLTQDLVSPATGAAKIWSQGALRPLPKKQFLGVPFDLDDLAASGVLSEAGLARAAEDLTMGADAPRADESVGSLIRRRLGDEVMDRLVGPLLGGINAGDADNLSLQGGVPRLAEAAAHDPSLIRSVQLHLQQTKRDPSAPIFNGHPNGTGQIIDALQERLKTRIALNQPVTGMEANPAGGWTLHTPAGPTNAKAVVITCPTFAASPLLADHSPTASQALADIDYASVTFVTMAFDKADIQRFDGSGFLIPRGEGLLMTACSWASAKWAHLGDGPTEYLRVSAGHSGDDRAMHMSDEDVVAQLLEELSWVAGVEATPLEVRVTRWPRALPQYRPGHLERVAGIEEALATDTPGVFATGAAFRGLGLPACVQQGRIAAHAAEAFAAGG